ncbi:hypothetical protein [Nostoc sp.]
MELTLVGLHPETIKLKLDWTTNSQTNAFIEPFWPILSKLFKVHSK